MIVEKKRRRNLILFITYLDQLPSKFVELSLFDYTLYEENCGWEWKNWHRSFEWYLKANHIEDEYDKFLKLMHLAGRKVQEVFETLPVPPSISQVRRGPLAASEEYIPQLSDYEMAIAKLNEFFEPKKNSTYERHMFRLIKQEKNEKVGIFVMRLRTRADKCDFGDTLEDNVKDQIIEKCLSPKLRRELLKLGDAPLDKVLKAAKIFEAIEEQSKTFEPNEMQSPKDESVNKVDSKPLSKPSWATKDKQVECTRCGFVGHRSSDDKCPAKGKTCNKCGGRDHFSRRCKTKKRTRSFYKSPHNGSETNFKKEGTDSNDGETSNKKPKTEVGETIKLVNSSHSPEDEYIFCIGNDSGNEITLKIGGVQLTVVLDSGSKFNVIDNKTWEFLKTNKIEVFNQSKIVNQSFKAYGSHPLTTIGSFDAKIETKQNCLIANFIVVKDYGKALIGYNTGIPLGVIKIGECVNQVEQNGQMSKIKGFVVDIPINDDVKPVAQPYRRVPVALEETVDKKIEELLSLGIIEKVNEPSKWISPVVPVPKHDDVRICIDMRRANEAVERENHPLPTMEDFLPHIGKGHFFAKLDVKNAFHQV